MEVGKIEFNPQQDIKRMKADFGIAEYQPGVGGGVGSPFVVKDSGARKQFQSGSLRDTTDGKIDYSRAFDGPLLERLAAHLTKAEAKYPDYAPGKPNWTLINTEEELVRYRKSAVRHFIQWLREDTDEDHFAATVFNMNGVEYLKEGRQHGI